MCPSKLPKGASDRLLNLLYSSALNEIAPLIPRVGQFLYEKSSSPPRHQQPQPQHQQTSTKFVSSALENSKITQENLNQFDRKTMTVLPSAGLRGLNSDHTTITTTTTHKSILDDLKSNQWNHKPSEDALKDLPKGPQTSIKSNVLRFSCKSNYLTEATFQNLYPIKRERKYLIPTIKQAQEILRGKPYKVDEIMNESNRSGIDSTSSSTITTGSSSKINTSLYSDHMTRTSSSDHAPDHMTAAESIISTTNHLPFHVIKGRTPLQLQPIGSYYLIFPTHLHACIYYLETMGKVVNGFDLSLEFISMHGKNSDLKYLSSPFLDDSMELQSTKSVSSSNDLAADDFVGSPTKSKLFHQLSSSPHHHENLPLAALLSFASSDSRTNCVLVRNLPFGLSKHTLPKLLWDYELAPLNDPSKCIVEVSSDIASLVHVVLIRFANHTNAKRFVRNFHGRKWESGVQSRSEKKLYDPLFCEILD